jgi:hypothetical protein
MSNTIETDEHEEQEWQFQHVPHIAYVDEATTIKEEDNNNNIHISTTSFSSPSSTQTTTFSSSPSTATSSSSSSSSPPAAASSSSTESTSSPPIRSHILTSNPLQFSPSLPNLYGSTAVSFLDDNCGMNIAVIGGLYIDSSASSSSSSSSSLLTSHCHISSHLHVPSLSLTIPHTTLSPLYGHTSTIYQEQCYILGGRGKNHNHNHGNDEMNI